jgi:hypothetical protein
MQWSFGCYWLAKFGKSFKYGHMFFYDIFIILINISAIRKVLKYLHTNSWWKQFSHFAWDGSNFSTEIPVTQDIS